MQQFLDAGPAERFVIYLNDHRGLVAAESDLARRSHAANSSSGGDSELVTVLAGVLAQNLDDRERLDDLLATTGGRANPFKTAVARIGDRIGRLKLNGQLRGYSPLSRVVEIEALLASTTMRHSMWTSIHTICDGADSDDARRRADVVRRHHDDLLRCLDSAVSRAFGTG